MKPQVETIPLPQTPAAPAPPPMFGSQTPQKKPQAKSGTPTFLGADASPSKANVGQATLLGRI